MFYDVGAINLINFVLASCVKQYAIMLISWGAGGVNGRVQAMLLTRWLAQGKVPFCTVYQWGVDREHCLSRSLLSLLPPPHATPSRGLCSTGWSSGRGTESVLSAPEGDPAKSAHLSKPPHRALRVSCGNTHESWMDWDRTETLGDTMISTKLLGRKKILSLCSPKLRFKFL